MYCILLNWFKYFNQQLEFSTVNIIHAPSPKVLGVMGCIGKNPSPILARDKAKIEYISLLELVITVI